jgi:transcriptional regulator with XRE-family HTH domain
MEDKDFGARLKAVRLAAKKTVAEVSAYLTSLGRKASEKTIYSWEAGRSQPTPDTLLDMCEFYGVSDVLAAFGYKKEKPTGVPADEPSENERIFMSLPPDLRQEALRYMRYLVEQEGKQ